MESLQQSHQRRQETAGFSLIELIGVMAVMAILASVILPSLIKRIQIEAAKNESAFLDQIGGALIDHLRSSKEIPDQHGWAQVVAAELGVQPDEILESPQQSRRLYLIDPALRLGAAGGTLSFAQTTAGSPEPISPRVMILSSMDGTKPIPLGDGVIGAEEFETLWNLPSGGVPPGWSDRWQKSAGDLKVRRINFAPEFHKVMLSNYDSIDPGTYSIDGGSVQVIPYAGINAYFVDGTVLGLHDGAGILETRQIPHRSVAFTFERGTWRGQVHLGLKLAGDDVYNATTLFANSGQSSLALAGATPSVVIDRFTDYMNRYVEWDAANFPTNESQSYNAVLAAQAALGNTTSSLIYSH
ncbi:MAG: prepilin-type N-terminal cleavage/methylation domain-containing protein [Pseudoalteromonas tetraodonis]|jgi:prepilin-type N-terminal cleavage/methylation domain-containing protein